jgi:glycosyltransferase involved in cell wall biosynthesis
LRGSDLAGKPFVSVMIGVYNGAAYLREAIESVLRQSHRPVELIVVDDGSEDESGRIARSFGGAVRCITQERGGMAAARNRAVADARGDYFAFLDADDRFRPDKIERQLSVFGSDPEVDAVFGHVTEFLSPDLDEVARSRLRQPVDDVPWPTPNLMLVKRDSFFRVGLFSTALKVGIGVDWYARAMEAGLKQVVPPIVVLERRLHSDNNGIRQSAQRPQYLHVLKASLDRRRGVIVEDRSAPRPKS